MKERELNSGDKVDKWIVEKRLSPGHSVYAVHLDSELNSNYVLKIAKNLTLFVKEVYALQRLCHSPYTPTLIEYSQDIEQPWFVMTRALPGHNIAQVDVDGWNKDRIIRLIRAVLDAISCGIQGGILIGDMKPEHILMNGDMPMIVDFEITPSVVDVHADYSKAFMQVLFALQPLVNHLLV